MLTHFSFFVFRIYYFRDPLNDGMAAERGERNKIMFSGRVDLPPVHVHCITTTAASGIALTHHHCHRHHHCHPFGCVGNNSWLSLKWRQAKIPRSFRPLRVVRTQTHALPTAYTWQHSVYSRPDFNTIGPCQERVVTPFSYRIKKILLNVNRHMITIVIIIILSDMSSVSNERAKCTVFSLG